MGRSKIKRSVGLIARRVLEAGYVQGSHSKVRPEKRWPTVLWRSGR